MSVKEWIKSKTIDDSIYWLDRKIRFSGRKKERLVKKIISVVTEIDSIQDYAYFKKVICEMVDNQQFLNHACVGAESLHYGHLDSIFEYAGVPEKMDGKLFPAMEHAVRYQGKVIKSEQEISRCPNLLYQSGYCKKDVRDIQPEKPIFCIGPYIHYVEPYYDEVQTKKMKEKYGRILLVFPTHTLENSKGQFIDNNIVDSVMKMAEKKYDTVMVSAYWGNLDWDVYDEFEKRGAVLVSAGFREDPKFLGRLKSLISMADMITSNTIASPWGFSIYLNKPFRYILNPAEDLGEIEEYRVYETDFTENFRYLKILSAKEVLNECEKKLFDELYTYYCGTKDDIKTVEEMKAIISIAEDTLRISRGRFGEFDNAIRQQMSEYQNKGETLKEKLLTEALM